MPAKLLHRSPAKIILSWTVTLLILISTACTVVDGGAQAEPAPSGKDCMVANLPLKNQGRLTLATDQPAYEPWFSDDNPNNGKGYESALAYGVAAELGFQPEQVDWVVVGFNAMIAPGEKTFDAGINQVSITAPRRQNVDLSAPYYTTEQAVVALEGSKLAGITTIAELRGAKLGAQADSTSLAAINDQVQPDLPAAELDSNDAGVTALERGRIDGLVADLPTAVQLTSGQVDGGLVVGRIPPPGKAEQFGLVLDRGSKLTTCINQAIGTLEGNGTLARLQLKWLELPDIRPLG